MAEGRDLGTDPRDLGPKVRETAGREPTPSAAIIDSQWVKITVDLLAAEQDYEALLEPKPYSSNAPKAQTSLRYLFTHPLRIQKGAERWIRKKEYG
jgi:hypothetical protein